MTSRTKLEIQVEQEKARKQERRREREIGVCELFDGREGEKLKERERCCMR